MTEKYVDWLMKVYQERFGRPPAESDVAAHAAAILRGYARQVMSGDDLVSLVALEATERWNRTDADSDIPFLSTLATTANTIHHRIIRDARRRANLADPGQIPTPPVADDATIERIKSELLEGLSVEEHVIVERLLAGQPVDELATHLGVSRRTLYRRLSDIRDRIGDLEAGG